MSELRSYGLGLRNHYAKQISQQGIEVDWLEIHAENYFNPHSQNSYYLERIAAQKPISVHGVGLSLGSVDPLDKKHLKQLQALVDRLNPVLVSEHLSWSSVHGQHFNDLLPLPYTDETLNHFSDKVKQVQDALGRQILVENPSSYLSFEESRYSEPEFINRMVELSQCGLLLDINNIHVSCHNLGWNSKDYLAELNHQPVQEIHLAGYTEKQVDDKLLLIDSHNQSVHPPVWELFKHYIEHYALNAQQQLAILLEWDSDFPELELQLGELAKARDIVARFEQAMERSHA